MDSTLMDGAPKHNIQFDEADLHGESLQAALRAILGPAATVLPGVDSASLVLWDARAGAFSLSESTVADQPNHFTARRVRKKGGATRHIIDTAEALFVGDIQKDPFTPNPMLEEFRFNAYAGLPLTYQDQVLGVFYTLYKEKRSFSPAERDILQSFSRLVSLAVLKTLVSDDLLYRATTDELTGLYRKHYFNRLAAREHNMAVELDLPISLLMVDIDHFKRVNDENGHLVGDLVIAGLAATLRKSTRKFDIIGRYGGDEFSLLSPGLGQKGAQQLAERIRSLVAAKSYAAPGREVRVTASIGVACLEDREASLENFIELADAALFEAKRAGRNRVVLHP